MGASCLSNHCIHIYHHCIYIYIYIYWHSQYGSELSFSSFYTGCGRKVTATHCNTLQHTATHCDTLRHCLPSSCQKPNFSKVSWFLSGLYKMSKELNFEKFFYLVTDFGPRLSQLNHWTVVELYKMMLEDICYRVASISRLLKIVGLFCKRAL